MWSIDLDTFILEAFNNLTMSGSDAEDQTKKELARDERILIPAETPPTSHAPAPPGQMSADGSEGNGMKNIEFLDALIKDGKISFLPSFEASGGGRTDPTKNFQIAKLELLAAVHSLPDRTKIKDFQK